jgi:hypothetical protein
MSASLQRGTAWGELSSSTLRDRASSHAGYTTRVAERQRRRHVTGAASSTVELARTDPEWAWLLIRLEIPHNLAFAALGPFAQRDLDRGIKAGRFKVPQQAGRAVAAGGALVAVMRAVVDGQAPRNADRHHAEGVLRLFGLEPEDAAEVARRPMPKIPPGPR